MIFTCPIVLEPPKSTRTTYNIFLVSYVYAFLDRNKVFNQNMGLISWIKLYWLSYAEMETKLSCHSQDIHMFI